jgi:hypothetical protein
MARAAEVGEMVAGWFDSLNCSDEAVSRFNRGDPVASRAICLIALETANNLIHEQKEMVMLLKEIEWKGGKTDHSLEEVCPYCGDRSHAPGCKLNAIIRPVPEVTNG